MKKIIVAGAGHGGLAAAALLSQNGFDVTVFEKRKREELGHDWEDRFTFSILSEIIGKNEADFPQGSFRFRGDCAFVSPAKRKKVVIHYTDENRQKIMWRKPLLAMLIEHCEKAGVKFEYETAVLFPLVEANRVVGINTDKGEFFGDLVVDAAGVFSPVRSGLPEQMGIEKMPGYGDCFYAWRGYFNRLQEWEDPAVPFEVYMRHRGEQGLSWHCTNRDSVDVLIGRTDKLTKEKVKKEIEVFKAEHPWQGDELVHGGCYGVIPVRRPLTLMVADGYAAVGDSAFMTTPMNGMGIDLSLSAGELLARTVIQHDGDSSAKNLWKYNRDFHIRYGGETARNEGLKNAILSLPGEGVDFLFESEVIQASDLAGAGKNTSFSSLLGKFVRGMKKPKYFFALINGLIHGSKASKLYKNPPAEFDRRQIDAWSSKISALDITVE